MYDEVKKKVRLCDVSLLLWSDIIDEFKTIDHIAITTDGWTSRAAVPFVAITAHGLTQDFNLISRCLCCEVLRGMCCSVQFMLTVGADSLRFRFSYWRVFEKASGDGAA